jgi:hypothetical protein
MNIMTCKRTDRIGHSSSVYSVPNIFVQLVVHIETLQMEGLVKK